MRIVYMVVTLLLLLNVSAKTVSKTIVLRDYHKEGPFMFLTKFYLGKGTSRMDINYKYNG